MLFPFYFYPKKRRGRDLASVTVKRWFLTGIILAPISCEKLTRITRLYFTNKGHPPPESLSGDMISISNLNKFHVDRIFSIVSFESRCVSQAANELVSSKLS